MSSLKTVAGVAVVIGGLVYGAKAQRDATVEADSAVRQMVESSVRMNAADFNPQVALTARELKDFDIGGVMITRSRISAMIDSAFGGGEKCLTLALKWVETRAAWSVSHPGAVDRCEPLW